MKVGFIGIGNMGWPMAANVAAKATELSSTIPIGALRPLRARAPRPGRRKPCRCRVLRFRRHHAADGLDRARSAPRSGECGLREGPEIRHHRHRHEFLGTGRNAGIGREPRSQGGGPHRRAGFGGVPRAVAGTLAIMIGANDVAAIGQQDRPMQRPSGSHIRAKGRARTRVLPGISKTRPDGNGLGKAVARLPKGHQIPLRLAPPVSGCYWPLPRPPRGRRGGTLRQLPVGPA